MPNTTGNARLELTCREDGVELMRRIVGVDRRNIVHT